MDPDVVAAFFSGCAAVISSLLSIWLVRRRADADCNRRIKEIKEAMHEGWEESHQ